MAIHKKNQKQYLIYELASLGIEILVITCGYILVHFLGYSCVTELQKLSLMVHIRRNTNLKYWRHCGSLILYMM